MILIMKKNITLTLSLSLLMASLGYAQTPFPTGQNIALCKPGTNSAAPNYRIYTNTSASDGTTYVQGSFVTTTKDLNGIGLNISDNLLYAAAYSNSGNTIGSANNVNLYRIGADGNYQDLGYLPVTHAPGLSNTEYVNFSAAAGSTNNTYYYMTYGLTPAAETRITLRILNGQQPDLTAADVRMFLCWKNGISSLPVNPGAVIAGGTTGYIELDFSDVAVTSAVNMFLTQVNANYPNVFNSNGGIQDFAINPMDTKIYGYMSYPDNGNTVGRPVVINMPNGSNISTITPVGTIINTAPGQEIDGVQFDAAGNFYGLFTTGHFAQINLTTGALQNLTIISTLLSGNTNLRGDLAGANTTIPLPIQWLSFTGKTDKAHNYLEWSTATEKNSQAFIIERSANQKEWIAIGKQASLAQNGNSNSTLEYNFTDDEPIIGTNYYRLRQVDFDGNTTLSTVITITNTTVDFVKVYPNPATHTLFVSGIQKGDVIHITDNLGRIVLTDIATASTATLSIKNLAEGLYNYTVTNNTHVVATGKLVKK
jgi:hypothetical protein